MWHKKFNFAFSVAFVFLLMPGFYGCNSETPDEPAASSLNELQPAQKETEETTSVSAKPTIESSPAAPKSVLPPKDADPEIVCKAFLALLQKGNRVAAENLLTRSALAVTGRADLQLEPIGTESATYELGAPLYATNKQKLAQVACKIVDVVDGEKSESELTWLVRKQKEGWRISGILLQMEANQPQDLLSFENYNDVLKIKSSLVGDDSGGQRQAAAPNDFPTTK